jgi:hypothetical protein
MSHPTSSTPTVSVPASTRVHSTTAKAQTKASTPATVKALTKPSTLTKASALTAVPASARVHPTTTHIPAGHTTLRTGGTTGGISLNGSKATGAGTTGTPAKSTVLGHLVLHKRPQHSSTLSTAAIAAVVVAAVLVLACLGWALARRRAFEPHWLLSLRHAMAEAGFRASATWAEFSDWVRLGH